MTPYLVTAPSALPVTLAEMKAHLRVVHADDDADIAAKQAGAVAMLDGWGGLLGRCIMPQTWRQDFSSWGILRLAFPDTSLWVVSYKDQNGDFQTIEDFGGGFDGAGCFIEADGPETSVVRVQYQCALPEPRISAAETLIKLMVQREFDVMSGPEYDAITRSIQALIGALRWRRI